MRSASESPSASEREGGGGKEGAERLAKKWNKQFHGARKRVFESVLEWRDRVARDEDESYRYVSDVGLNVRVLTRRCLQVYPSQPPNLLSR